MVWCLLKLQQKPEDCSSVFAFTETLLCFLSTAGYIVRKVQTGPKVVIVAVLLAMLLNLKRFLELFLAFPWSWAPSLRCGF